LVLLGSLFVLGAFAMHGCSGDEKKNPVAPPTGADVTINIVADMGSTAFGGTTTVTVGQTVSWHNTRGTTHTSTANGGAWNTGNIAAGATSTPIQMNTAGSFPYECSIHPTMTGTLTVNP